VCVRIYIYMGLISKAWLKQQLRSDSHLQSCMHYASYSKARRQERKEYNGDVNGKGVELGFQVAIIELMLKKYQMPTGCQKIQDFKDRWKKLAAEQIKRFPDAHTFVFLLDDETNVPQAKSQTQQKRKISSSGKELGFSPEELKELGPHFSRLCNHNPDEFNRRVGSLFSKEAQDRGISSFEVFMQRHMHTSGLREDEFEFATRCLVSASYKNLGEGRRIIIDRGVWRPSYERNIATDMYKGGDEPWESIVHSFEPDRRDAEHDKATRAWILIDAWGSRRLEAMEQQHLIGEADLKIPHYARLFAGQKIFVVCSDTDLIPILLLTVKDWVPLKGKCPGKLFLDVTHPSDEKNKKGALPRKGVIDMIQFWRNLHAWFKKEYHEVLNPIEVFVVVLIMGGTDFLDNPPTMRAKTIWRGFNRTEARMHIAKAIVTDGHIGGALPRTKQVAETLTQQYFIKAKSRDQATQCLLQVLLRDPTESTFVKRTQQAPGLDHCPKKQRVRHISVYEQGMLSFFAELYDKVGPKDASKWPTRAYRIRLIRQISWQLSYWYSGDTYYGRYWHDEMAVNDDSTKMSVHGWQWEEDTTATTTTTSDHHKVMEANKTQLTRNRKRKAGCLGRRRPHRKISSPAISVVSIQEFHAYRKRQRRLQTENAS